jgi:hypothetical protein
LVGRQGAKNRRAYCGRSPRGSGRVAIKRVFRAAFWIFPQWRTMGLDWLPASLCRPDANDDVTRNDFVIWAEKVMDCRRRLGVKGLDLYAARCGVVHTYTPDSKLHRKGHAKRIMYSWGTKEPHDANSLVRGLGLTEVFIKVEVLFDTFLYGVERFSDDVLKDPERERLVLSRDRKLFADVSSFP